jgi:hypothetical protein
LFDSEAVAVFVFGMKAHGVAPFGLALGVCVGLSVGLPACSSGGFVSDEKALPDKDKNAKDELLFDQVSPSRGPTTGGIPITIRGRKFEADMRVQFAGVDATQVSLKEDDVLGLLLPPNPGVIGPVEVRLLRNDGKEAVRQDLFAYYPGQLAFAQPQSFATDAKPTKLAVEDVNQDGKLDVLAASHDNQSLSILRGKAEGRFDTYQRVSVKCRPRSMLFGEMTGDRFWDVAVSCDQAGPSVLLYPGKGDGTFLQAKNLADVPSAALAGGDYNADGKLDIAVPYFAFMSNGIGFLYGNGDGTFKDGGSIVLPSGSFGVSSADFNGDGKGDLAVTLYDNSTVGVLLSQGSRFSSVNRVPAGAGPHSVVAADFNGDSKADLVVSDPDGNALRVLLGNGNGTFQPAVVLPTSGKTPQPVATADLNLDGWLDLITVNVNSPGTVTVFLGKGAAQGAGMFASPQPIPASGTHMDVVTADVNGDRLPDLLLPVSDGSQVQVLLNQSK